MRNTILVLFVALASLGAWSPSAAVAAEPWEAQFRSYDVISIDPKRLIDQLDAGSSVLDLPGGLYAISVAPVPWEVSPPVYIEQPDGSFALVQREFESRGYAGVIVGVANSRVFLTVTEGGTTGYLRTPEMEVHLQAMRFISPSSAREATVVYDIRDLISPPRRHTHESGDPPGGAPVAAADLGTQHTSRPNVEHIEWANSAFVADIGGWNNLHGFLDTRMNAANDIIIANLNYHYSRHWVTGCTTGTCDSSWGMSGRGVNSLGTWAQAVLANGPRESAQLHSGSTHTDGSDGRAYRAGRYSVEDVPTNVANAYAAKVIAHELIHNVNSDHPFAETWVENPTYTHFHKTCAFEFFICIGQGQEPHTHTLTETHYSLDHTDGYDDPIYVPDQDEQTAVWETTIAEGNLIRIDACKGTEVWYGISHAPGNHACG